MYVKAYNVHKLRVNFEMIIIIAFSIYCIFRIITLINLDDVTEKSLHSKVMYYNMPVLEEMDENSDDLLSFKEMIFKMFDMENISFIDIVNRENSFFDMSYSPDEGGLYIETKPFKIDDKSITIATSELKKDLNSNKAEVLIYHTHTTEAFAEKSPDSSDENYNVVGVGEEVKKYLEQDYGIAVIHDKTNHSESYVGCYQRARETINNYLSKKNEFKLVIDLHRDSVTNKNTMTTTINGEDYARIMFVNAKNSKKYEKNKETATFFYNKMNELFPTACRGIYTYKAGIMSFNQDLSDNALLIECGSNINTIAEAKNSAKLIARVIAEYINR